MLQSAAALAIAVLGVGGAVVALVLPLDGPVRWAIVGVGVVLAVVGVVVALSLRRDARPVALAPVAPGSVPASTPRPWPLDAVAAELAGVLDGSPYRVLAGPGRIRIQVDERDPRYWQCVMHWRPMIVQHWDVDERGRALRTVEGIEGLVWPPNPGPPARTGRALNPTPRFIQSHERQHVDALHPHQRWRLVTSEVLAHLEPVAARAGRPVRRSMQRLALRILYPFIRAPR